MIKAAIIDFDDTLIQTSRFRRGLLETTIRRWNGIASEDPVSLNWGQPFRIMVESFVGKDKYDLFKEFYKKTMLQTTVNLCDGVEQFLCFLKQQQIPVVIFSSSIRELIELDLNRLGVLDLITHIIDSESVIKPKPNPEALYTSLKWLQDSHKIMAADCVYIGDSLDDMRCAGNQIDFYAVLSGTTTRQDFLTNGLPENKIVESLDDLVSVLFP